MEKKKKINYCNPFLKQNNNEVDFNKLTEKELNTKYLELERVVKDEDGNVSHYILKVKNEPQDVIYLYSNSFTRFRRYPSGQGEPIDRGYYPTYLKTLKEYIDGLNEIAKRKIR